MCKQCEEYKDIAQKALTRLHYLEKKEAIEKEIYELREELIDIKRDEEKKLYVEKGLIL